jgi:la-related protein 1
VWLEGARLELRYGDKKVARKCMLAALQYAPLKSRTAVLIDWARLEQYLGGSTGTDTDTDTNSDSDGDGGGFQEARRILAKTKSLVPSDWKVHLESILLELRAGAILQALELARTALRMFPSSGRLVRYYALLILSLPPN